MRKRQRSRIITKLPPIAKVVVPTPVVTDPYPGVGALAEGLAADFVFALERLGGVSLDTTIVETTLSGEEGATGPPLSISEPDGDTIDDLLTDYDADHVLVNCLNWPADDQDPSIEFTLKRAGDEVVWSGTFGLMEGAVWQWRLAMASEMVAVATGEPIDASPLLKGGPIGVRGYRLLCEARCEHLLPVKRIELCQQALALQPDYGEAGLLLADLLLSTQQMEEADTLIRSLPERFPEMPRCFLRRGKYLAERGDHQAAQKDIAKAMGQDADALALYEAGQFMMSIGDEEAGSEAMQRSVERRCCEPFLYEQLGVYRANEGQEVAAVLLWERALEIDPSLHGILANLALGHHRLGNDDRADALFAQAAEKAPEHFATHYNLGLYYQDLRSWDLAVGHLSKAIEMRPNFPVLHLNKGLCLLRIGRNRDAKDALKEASRLDPSGPIGRQAEDEAARIFIPVDPIQDAREFFQKGADRVKANRPEQGIPYLKKAVKIAPRYWQAWFYLGTCYRLQSKWESSVEAFRKVISIRDDQPDAHNELSVALGQLGRRDGALEHARLAHDLRPEDPGIISNLGLALMELNRHDEARHHFQRALKLDPDDQIVQRCLKELEERQRKTGG